MIESILKSFEVWSDAQGIKSRGRVKSIDNISFEGISRLRELILDLAIRGKLVSQNSDDETANVLLEKSADEKTRLVEEGKIKKNKKLDDITEDIIPFELPDGWKWAWFADAYFFQEGPGIRNWQFRTKGIKLLNVQNIVNNKVILDNTDKYIDEKEYQEKYVHFTIEENDLLFASSGGSWGKSAFFSDYGYKVIVNTSTIRIHPYIADSSRKYLKHFLDSNFFKQQMIEQLVGMQPNFGSTHLLKILVPVPPSNEQFRISEKVDELMVVCEKLEKGKTNNLKTHQYLVSCLLETLTNSFDVDVLKASWERISQQFDTLFCTEESIEQLKQSILQLAAMGKLVKQNPSDTASSELIKQIAEEKIKLIEEGKLKEEKQLLKISEEEKPFQIPNTWEWVRLGDIAKLTGGFAYKSSSFLDDGKHQVVRMGNIRPNFLRLDENPVFISEQYGSETSDYKIEMGDILLTMTGTKDKKDYLYSLLINAQNLKEKTLYLNQRLCLVRLILIRPEFINTIIKDDRILDSVFTQSTGTANQANIGMAALRNLVLPLPPIKEQDKILKRINELFSICDKLSERINKSQNIKGFLTKTIAQNAIS